jgi:hypothetical protein
MEKEGKTLWEMLMDRLNKGNGSGVAFLNPLELSVGAAVPVAHANGPEFAGYDFSVQEIREYTRTIGGRPFRFSDYVLRGVNTNSFAAGDVLTARLRAVPNEAGGHDRLLLRPYDEFAFAEEFLEVLNDTTGVFEVSDDDTEAKQVFTRINDLRGPHEAAVLVVSDMTPEGKAGKSSALKLQYWDYWRDVELDERTVTKEFVFVEMNTETGWFQIWRGGEFYSV